MMKLTQKQIAETARISSPYLSQIISRDRTPSWRVAKRIAEVTDTDPFIWLEGTSAEIRSALQKHIDTSTNTKG